MTVTAGATSRTPTRRNPSDSYRPRPGIFAVPVETMTTFFSENGVLVEDPVTGSLNAAAAQWFIQSDRCSAPYSVSQGLAINHKGEVKVTQDHDGSIWIGGNTHLTSFAEVEI